MVLKVSNVHRPFEQRVAHYAAKGLDVTPMVAFMRVDEAYIRAGLDAIDERWPSREAYFADALGFGQDRIEMAKWRMEQKGLAKR